MKNMVQEIKEPMQTVMKAANALNPEKPSANETQLIHSIQSNADNLLHLIENILFLSRLEAHMQEYNNTTNDLAPLFDIQCACGWDKYRNDKTRYIADNPYKSLVVDINTELLGSAIAQLTANSAQHTSEGSVRARYEYIGRRLIISVIDTGVGISKDELAQINMQLEGKLQNAKGLGLAICHEVVRQMNGTMEIDSEEGVGTTVYITIPCQASVIKRKRLAE